MKEFHIVSSGVSLITNAQRKGILPKDKKISDEDYWQELLNRKSEITSLYDFLREAPYENSAELNTFLRVVKDKSPTDIEIYLFGTNTYSNELSRLVISQYLKESGYNLFEGKDFSGYFFERKFSENYAKSEFEKDISSLLDKLIYLGKKKIEQGYKVYYNPTGGLKAHVIATALAGFIVDSEVYYMNEEFNEVIFFPKLFYIPKGKEAEILKMLKERVIISGEECKELVKKNNDEIERLNLYDLIHLEVDEKVIYRLKISHKGEIIAEMLNNA